MLFLFYCLSLAVLGLFVNVAHGDELADLVAKSNEALKKLKDGNAAGGEGKQGNCTTSNAIKRKDWDYMTDAEKIAYTTAVRCLYDSPGKSGHIYPGVKTRNDDFVAQHINQTLSIHQSAYFLPWHRHFLYTYEQVLRNECGYKGYVPYWNWFSNRNNFRTSSMFDGSATSMSSNGAYLQNNGTYAGGGKIYLAPEEGGGCIKSGPFKGVQISLGPILPKSRAKLSTSTYYEPNPRCLSRDLRTNTTSHWFTIEGLQNMTTGAASASIEHFQDTLQGASRVSGDIGMHATGHFAMGMDSDDFYCSTNEPMFFLHHAMIDLLWYIWQALHPEIAHTIAGTITMKNDPPSRNGTLDDLVQTEFLNMETKKIGDLMDTLSGGTYCYMYE